MALTLALLEGGLLFVVVLMAILVWAHPLLLDWNDIATLLAQVMAICGCCITAFYYNDFYNLRIVKSSGAFAARFLPSFGLGADRVVVALTERRGRLPLRQILDARLDGVVVEDGVDVYERLTGKLAIESLTPGRVIFSRDFRKSRLDRAVGRGLSLVVAAAGLLVLAPLLGLIALAITLDAGRPILFVHERLGLRGRRFKLLKFRTMRPADGTTSERVRDNADRISRVGRVLRKFRLDELPQFVNIPRGDMNLVGPRPHPVSNLQLFSEHIPYYRLDGPARGDGLGPGPLRVRE